MRPWLMIAAVPLVACTADGPGAAPDAALPDECPGRVVPTCDDGTRAIAYEEFAPGTCGLGTSGGGQWRVFGDAVDPTYPVTGVIVHATALYDDGRGTARVGIAAQFGALQVADLTEPAWLRWTILGVNENGVVLELSRSSDGSTWSQLETSDAIGIPFVLTAATSCPLSMPPVPCGALVVELSDAIFVCRTAL